MSKSFNDMIYLFSCGARGIKPILSHKIDIIQIQQQAITQAVWPACFLALKQLHDESRIVIDKEVFDKWHKEIVIYVMQTTRKKDAIFKAMQLLQENGIQCCVLKGEALAPLYANSVCRVSGDTDILIEASMEEKVANFLKDNGFMVAERLSTSNHLNAVHPIAGEFEFHISLYTENFEIMWIKFVEDKNEDVIQLETDQRQKITTLGINDGLRFLTLHFIKHFLFKGAGIKQLMDILLYMSHYKNDIDWDAYQTLLQNLKFDKLMDNCIAIGTHSFGFNEEELPSVKYDGVLMQKILDDMEQGGVFGFNDTQRTYFSAIVNQERAKVLQQKHYRLGIKAQDFFKRLFMNKVYLMKKYPYIQKHNWLIGMAWIHRFYDFALEIIKGKRKMTQFLGLEDYEVNNEVLKARLDLIRELDML